MEKQREILNAADEGEESPLLVATQFGHLSFVQALAVRRFLIVGCSGLWRQRW